MKPIVACAIALHILLLSTTCCQAALTGSVGIHDPSTIVKDGTRYYVFGTGQGISTKYSTNLTHWQTAPRVFGTAPEWTRQEVPANQGHLWAPDVIKYGDEYRLYYSVSSFGSQDSAIGLATNVTLDSSNPDYSWEDRGLVIDSETGYQYNAIDPGVFYDDTTGRMWLTFGSFWSGIFITELNPNTGKPFSSAATNIARNPVVPPNAIEAPYMVERDGYYYLFVNWGSCCQGVNSTYQIRVGRSSSPTGPFQMRGRGPAMINGGGELFLATEGDYIGPGHMSIFSEHGIDYFGYHYYDGADDGRSKYNVEQLAWTMNGWPIPASDVIPGDFNGDLVVDRADLLVWNAYFGDKANGMHFLDWQRNYGATSVTYRTFAAVPEPTAIVLVLCAAMAPLVRRSRRRRG